MPLIAVAKEKCETCIYRLKYDRRTRDRLNRNIKRKDTFIACHSCKRGTVCRGHYDAHYEKQTGGRELQIARRFELMGHTDVVGFVEAKK